MVVKLQARLSGAMRSDVHPDGAGAPGLYLPLPLGAAREGTCRGDAMLGEL